MVDQLDSHMQKKLINKLWFLHHIKITQNYHRSKYKILNYKSSRRNHWEKSLWLWMGKRVPKYNSKSNDSKLVVGVYFKISLFLRGIMKRKKSHRLEGKFVNCSSDLKNTENETQK